MLEFMSDIPFVSLFIKFMIASTILLSAVWLMEKTRLINTPDLAELAWKLAIAGSFVALLPVADIMSSTLVIQDDRTAALIDDLNQNRPLSTLAADPSVDRTFTKSGSVVAPVNNIEIAGRPVQNTDTASRTIQPGNTLVSPPDATPRNAVSGAPYTVEFTTAADANNAPIPGTGNDSEGTKEKTFWYSAADLRTKDLAVLGWIALALLTVGALMFSYRDAVKNLGNRKRVDAEGKANQALRAICEKADIRHVPYLSRSGAIKSPVCLPRKEICLPNWAFDDMPSAEFKSLLAHELGHMVRRDPIMLMVLQILSRTFFFQPLFIIARKRLTDIAELAADEWAAKQAADSRSVANALFTCATKIHETRQIQWGMAMAGNKSILKQRVERLIHAQSVPFKTAGTFAKTAIGVGVIGLSLGMPSIEFAGAMTAENSLGNDMHRVVSTQTDALSSLDLNLDPASGVSVQIHMPAYAPFASTITNATTAVAPLALAHPHGEREFLSRDNDSGNISWSSDGKSISINWEGDFRINEHDSSLEVEDEDSFIRIKGKEDGIRRSIKFEVENGKRAHTYKVDGKKQELDAAGQKWLKGSIQTLINSGFGAEQRVARILKKSKVKGVLKETKAFEGDFVRRIYLTELMRQAKLKDKEITQVIDIVAKFDSDFEKRLTLSFMLETEIVSDKVLPRVLKVAKTFDSDFEKRLLVTHFVSEMKLTNKSTVLVLDVAESIDSDFELRLLLTSALSDTKLTDKNVQRILDMAIKKIDSDFEKRLLLTSFADEYNRSDAVVAKVLAAAKTVDSNFERRILLSTLISQAKLNEKNWLTAINIASDIDSDFEKSRALMHFRSEIPKDNKKIVAALDKAMEGTGRQFRTTVEFSTDSDFDVIGEDIHIEFSEQIAEFGEAMAEFAEELAELEIEKVELMRERNSKNSKATKEELREKSRAIREKQREIRAIANSQGQLERQMAYMEREATREIKKEMKRVARDLKSADKDLKRELAEALRQLERTKVELKRQFRTPPENTRTRHRIHRAPERPERSERPERPERPEKPEPSEEGNTL